jgi:hypothetical protein
LASKVFDLYLPARNQSGKFCVLNICQQVGKDDVFYPTQIFMLASLASAHFKFNS